MLRQRTLKSLTRAVGVGLHSGQRVELTLRPAPAGHRHRVPPRRPAGAGRHPGVGRRRSRDTRLASTISNGGAKVQTVEHLMSACAGLGLDNLYVDITAEEVPILDGSSASLRVPAAKRRHRAAERAAAASCACCKPVEVREGEGDNLKWARLEPYHGYKLGFEIDFDHRVVELHRPALRVRPGLAATTRATSRAPAPSASPRTWR